MTSLETVKFVAAALTRLSCIHSFSKASCADYDLLFLCQGAAAASVAVALILVRQTYASADGFAATDTLRVARVRSSRLGQEHAEKPVSACKYISQGISRSSDQQIL